VRHKHSLHFGSNILRVCVVSQIRAQKLKEERLQMLIVQAKKTATAMGG
jgi:hypothetical protein